MDTIQPGASFADLIAKQNEIIQWINTFEATPISYNNLQNKPRIDNVELTEASSMKDLRIDLAQLPNVAQLEELVTNVAGNYATATAETVASQKVQTELAIENAKAAGIQPQDAFKLFFFAKNEANEEVRYSLTFDELAEYVIAYMASERAVVGS